MEKGKIIPFYMAYPLPLYYEDEQGVVKDMEYLQSQHSPEIRSLQREIMEVINLLDYEGSMIYDEYPDRISLYKLAADITDSIIRDENIMEKTDANETDKMNKEHIGVIVQILLYYEIHNRRYKRSDSFLNF